MTIPCPDCAHDRPGEIHRAGGVYSLCPTCDGEGTLEKLQSIKADISPGTQPPGYSACILSPEEREEQQRAMEERFEKAEGLYDGPCPTCGGSGKADYSHLVSPAIRALIEALGEQLQALTKRVEKLGAGEFGK